MVQIREEESRFIDLQKEVLKIFHLPREDSMDLLRDVATDIPEETLRQHRPVGQSFLRTEIRILQTSLQENRL